jgi:hypothetical protein
MCSERHVKGKGRTKQQKPTTPRTADSQQMGQDADKCATVPQLEGTVRRPAILAHAIHARCFAVRRHTTESRTLAGW